jgi:hypothetical protein
VIANGNVLVLILLTHSIFSEQENNALEKLNIAPTDFCFFIFVGRLVGEQGINELIATFFNSKLKTLNFVGGLFEQTWIHYKKTL